MLHAALGATPIELVAGLAKTTRVSARFAGSKEPISPPVSSSASGMRFLVKVAGFFALDTAAVAGYRVESISRPLDSRFSRVRGLAQVL
jgi:hypothetical protein